ncbi:DUF2798 domain-containing protein [Sulfurospirillum sp. T05]|uniref:DUF2798 domain-containing protein n=1 Tax=Sulfurospirillum tamanense TaxID=2813362 RepID=A0ABS2WR31_9BACT|nr:DUF2798 domain-containing protein [Sulfurospirillum tamanensis]
MIPKRYEFLLFAFFMSLFMSFLMSGVITLINIGAVEGFLLLWFLAFVKAFLVAFPTILVVVPQVRKLVGLLIEKN